MRAPLIAVVGPADVPPRALLWSAAVGVGRAVARSGAVLVCGGLGGVMAAAASGARAFAPSAQVIGLLPGDDADAANEFVSIALPTRLGELRNGLVAGAVDGMVAVGGSWGTLSEIALALRWGLPVAAVSGWRVLDEAGRPVPDLVHAEDAEAAVASVLSRIGPHAP
jgi:uncharacterized protein (TIGR00725 family)